jgi:UTP-glucose-1-phosphate uridylyltransferase
MIIPAAGYGIRMRLITKGGSKEIVEIGGRPSIMYALLEALHAGLFRVGIVIRKGKEDIVEVVQKDPRLAAIRSNMHIVFFEQKRPNGEVGAIAAATQWLGEEPFVVHYPDNIVTQPSGVIATLIAKYMELKEDIVLLTSCLDHAQAKLIDLKSLGNGFYRLCPGKNISFDYELRPTGIYVTGKVFLETYRQLVGEDQNNEIKDYDVRCRMAKNNSLMYGIDMSATVLDVGNVKGYRFACNVFLK